MNECVWVVTIRRDQEEHRRTFDGRPTSARVRAMSFAQSMERAGWKVEVKEEEATR